MRLVNHLLRVSDLTDDEVDRVLARASELADGARPAPRGLVLGSLFLTPSMRTRVGFQVAAHRLGGSAVSVDELRVDAAMSAAESFDDALRVLAGMVDVVVTRTPFTMSPKLLSLVGCPVINGGDDVEHPTQGLIDLAAIERFRGDVRALHIGLCGDLRMRAAASLLQLLARRPPASVTLIYPDGREPRLPEGLAGATRSELAAGKDLDVLVMIGLAPGSGPYRLDEAQRRPYMLDPAGMSALPAGAVVLSPMPVIDEIADAAKADPRVRMYEQSDHAVHVRTAILEFVLGWLEPSTSTA
jgi:aspartate carbamoyltransferase catalytic subunit